MNSLKSRWQVFLGILLDPWTFLLTVAVAALFVTSLQDIGKLATALVMVMLTLASSVVGSRATHQWAQATEGGILRARGKSAVRSLKLLLGKTTALERRLEVFRTNEDHIENHPEVTSRNYEEAIGACRALAEDTVSSIENWTDIVPEADISNQIGVITELKATLAIKENEIANLCSEIEETKGQSEAERTELKKQISRKEAEARKLQAEITTRKLESGFPGLVSPWPSFTSNSALHIYTSDGPVSLKSASKGMEIIKTDAPALKFDLNKYTDNQQ